MESRIIHLTSAALKHGNLYITRCGRDFFPEDSFGETSAKKGTGKPVTLKVYGLESTINTDIPKDKKIFRRRAWVKEFVRKNNLSSDDVVCINRLSKRVYEIEPVNKQLTFIDLFAGIGGTRLAFEKAGCKCVFSSEWDKFAQQTYEANFGEKPLK